MPSLSDSFALPFDSASVGASNNPPGRDLALDKLTHDLTLVKGDLSFVNGIDAVRQEIDIRLRFLLGEWFLDKTAGVPYLQTVLVKTPNLAAVRTVLQKEILASAGISTLTRLDLDYNRSARTLTVTWSATTNLNALVSSEVSI